MSETSPGVEKKRERKDVKERLLSRRVIREYVVKACLKKYVDPEFREEFITCIHGRVESVSKCVIFGSRSLAWILKEIFDGVDTQNLLKADVPNIFDLTFIRQLLLGTDKCGKKTKKAIIEKFFKKHPYMLTEPERHKNDQNLFTHAAKKYGTNLKNNFKVMFVPRLKGYIKALAANGVLEEDERGCAIYEIMGWKKPKNMIASSSRVLQVAKTQRTILGVEDNKEIDEKWLDDNKNLKRVLYQWAFFMKEGFMTPFNLIPICNIKHHFVTIDNGVFKSICNEILEKRISKQAKKEECRKNKENVDETKPEEPTKVWTWKDLLNYERLEKEGSKFSGTIETDGVSVCVHFKQAKKKPLTKEQSKEEDRRIKGLFKDSKYRHLACDPGRTNIYTIVEVLDETVNGVKRTKVKKYVLTRKQYYNDSGINQANKETEKWNKKIQPTLDKLSQVTTKGISLALHMEYNKVFLETFNSMWDHYTNAKWANQRLRLYGGKKRALARFWNRVLGRERVRQPAVIAYGAAKFAPGGKGEVSVPTTSAFSAASKQKGLEIALTDEFCSTRRHCGTERLLDKVLIEGQEYPLRGLLWCGSTNNKKQGFLVDRDANAALNILRCAKEDTRPAVFDRKKVKEALPKWKVGKVLKNNVDKPKLAKGWKLKEQISVRGLSTKFVNGLDVGHTCRGNLSSNI